MTLSLRHPTSLEELLNYRLMRLYAESTGPVTRMMEGNWGISRRERRVLAFLSLQCECSPSALAEQVRLDRPRTPRALSSLHMKGLVARQTRQGDARRASVALTASGQAMYDEIFPHTAALNGRLMSGLDDATAEAFDRALKRLTFIAEQTNREVAQGVRADRQVGGTRQVRAWPGPPVGDVCRSDPNDSFQQAH